MTTQGNRSRVQGLEVVVKAARRRVLSRFRCVATGLFSFSLFAGLAGLADAAPYTNDPNTVLLDHFDGTTTGTVVGAVSFAEGIRPLDQNAVIPLTAFIMYPASIPYSSSGTIEVWVKPSQLPCSIMCYNGSYTATQPGGGYVMHITLNANGTVHWYGSGNLDGVTALPTNAWSHVAVTWGGGSTRIYVNGVEDAQTNLVYNPSGGYLYLNSSWGKAAMGSLDELRISKALRSSAELRSHYLANSVKYYPLAVTVSGSGTVVPTNGWYVEGTNVSLSVAPAAGWLFMGWSGDLTSGYAASNTVLVMDASKQVTATFSDDADADGVSNTNEGTLGTDPRNSDSDGDRFDDGFEVAHGYSPIVSDTAMTDYIRTHSSSFDLYPSNVVLDVAVGQILLAVSNGTAAMSLQLQQASALDGSWTNAGPAIHWTVPLEGSQQFFRVRSAP